MTIATSLRCAREHLLRALSPLASRLFPPPANYRGPVPPVWLRRHAGPPQAFFSAAAAAADHFDHWQLVHEGSRVLDFGCGPGALVSTFSTRIGEAGSYLGLDVHGPCARWCARAWRDDRRFVFRRLLAATPYSREARNVVSCRFEDIEGPFDLVVAKSVFTHLLPDDAARLLHALAAKLAFPRATTAGGALYFTAFTVDAERFSRQPPPCFPWRVDARAWTRSRWHPQAAVALDRGFLLTTLAHAGLVVAHEASAFFPGDATTITGQDVFVARLPET